MPVEIDASIGIVGMGFVGSAVARGFSEHVRELRCYDRDWKKGKASFYETIAADFVFVCLPTPRKEDSAADTSAITEFFSQAKNSKAQFILKSTVPPGTTRTIAESGLRICHSPEFLSARTAAIDFVTPSRIIVGHESDAGVVELFRARFPAAPILEMTSTESELVKYACNAFFATKITFFNEIRRLADLAGCGWENTLRGILSDGRIAHSHTQVPGHDGEFGFGGACLPKDLDALIYVAKCLANGDSGNTQLLEAVRDRNAYFRPEAAGVAS